MPGEIRVFGPSCGMRATHGPDCPAKGTEMRQLGSLGGRPLGLPYPGNEVVTSMPVGRHLSAAASAPQPEGRTADPREDIAGGDTIWRLSFGPPAATAGRVRLLARALHLDHDAAHQRRSYVLQGMRRERGIPRHRTHRSMIALPRVSSRTLPSGSRRTKSLALSRYRTLAQRWVCTGTVSPGPTWASRTRTASFSKSSVWLPGAATMASSSGGQGQVVDVLSLVVIAHSPSVHTRNSKPLDHGRPRCEPAVSTGDRDD